MTFLLRYFSINVTPMPVVKVTQDTFQKEVLDHKGYALVDFYADWCAPCKVTEPNVHELAEEMKDVKFFKVDVDQNPNVASQYSVFSIPTFVILKDGKPVSSFVGAMGKEGFVEEIKKAKGV